jgi:hypothetical protein
MPDGTYEPKVYRKQGGSTLVVASGGVIDIETGGAVKANGTQGAALTTQLTTLTHTAPGTPDYAIATLTQTSPFGFVAADEGHTVLSVIANLQVRLAEVEARLEALGLIVAN